MDKDKSQRILVVEDNVDDSFLLTRQIARAHIEDAFNVIGNGQDALDYLLETTTPPAAVFLDLDLPGLNGLQLLAKIRQEPRLKAVPVIVMTGSVDPHAVRECSKYGVTAYLPKPIDLATFRKIVTPLFSTENS